MPCSINANVESEPAFTAAARAEKQSPGRGPGLAVFRGRYSP
jgi:hypothetical protein